MSVVSDTSGAQTAPSFNAVASDASVAVMALSLAGALSALITGRPLLVFAISVPLLAMAVGATVLAWVRRPAEQRVVADAPGDTPTVSAA